MSELRINGKSFTVRVAGIKMQVESASLTITDNTTVAKNAGRPAGVLQGDVEASGELSLDVAEFNKLNAAAAAAGAWQDIPPFPIHFHAIGGGAITENMIVFADGCKLKISELLNVDPNSTDKSTIALPFDVTGRDFVTINGVPYVSGGDFTPI